MRGMLLAAAGLLSMLGACGQTTGQVEERHHILIAGSSTVYPFTRAVAERFHQGNAQLAPPVVQSTGTGAGFRLFCAGLGGSHPDLIGASRRMHIDEMQQCRSHGIANITELQIGIDGLAFVHSPAAPEVSLSRRQIYEALAATPYGQPNRARRWKEIDPGLPDIPILIYGPPASSGTQDSLRELILEPGCAENPEMRRLREDNQPLFRQVCTTLRTDGAYVAQGEDDERIAVQLIVNPGAIGVFGFSYLDRHGGQLRGIPIEGIAPREEAISSGRYSGARPLYVYVKSDQVDRVPGLRTFIAEYARATGPGGYLADRGLIPAPEPVRAQTAQRATNLLPLEPSSLR